MKRVAFAVCGLLVGVALSLGVGACDYFECATAEQPLLSGTYEIYGGGDYSFVLDLSAGTAVETYSYGSKPVRVEYSLGPDKVIKE